MDNIGWLSEAEQTATKDWVLKLQGMLELRCFKYCTNNVVEVYTQHALLSDAVHM